MLPVISGRFGGDAVRPINIRISAFGPYAGCTEIPMENLGDKGLYLITGDTGAGKTTIFDAICFALFGEPSGPSREAGMFRSKYASPETPTEVELTFSHMGKNYRIKRNPEYMRPAKKGGGETRQLSDATLELPDGSVITKVRNVNSRVEEILGINREQFSQIAMLAQGDFLKLLLSSTEERIKIFRDLFKTSAYQTLQNRLDDSFKEIYGQVRDGKKSIDQYIGGIRCESDNVLSIQVEKAKKGELLTEDVLLILDKLSQEDGEEKKRLERELSVISGELEEVNRRLGTARTIEKAIAACEEMKKKLLEEEPKGGELEQAFEEARSALGKKSELEKKAATIEADFPRYDHLLELKKQIDKDAKELLLRKEKLSETAGKREKELKDLEELKKEQSLYSDIDIKILRTGTELEESGRKAEAALEIRKLLDSFFEDSKDYEEKQKLYKRENDSFVRLNEIYESMDLHFRNAQAGILASSLKEGQECPVCGSVHHPRLALLPDEAPTEKELNKARKDAEKARKIRDDRAGELNGLRIALENKRKDLEEKCSRELGITDIEKARDEVTEKLAEIADKQRELSLRLEEEKKAKNRSEKLKKLIPGLDDEIAKADVLISEEKAGISADSARIEAAEKELKALSESLTFKSKADAASENKKLLAGARGLQEAYYEADKKLKDQKDLITGLKAGIREQEKIVEGAGTVDSGADKERLEQLKLRQEQCISSGEIVAGRLESNELTKKKILERSRDLADLEKRLGWIKTLADTANGKLGGKDKVRLETYVQTTYFDRIIERANLRLITMSGGQYELVRLKEADNTKSQSGLDLGVIDHYNASTRSVRTLSGGESFIAALSLALGLSDEVQSSAGGIRIDTMFVDEGFGSLDPDALDMAYRALAGLTEGNRLVGIISHVADLKDRIDRQIIVTKEKSGGSMVKIV